MKNLFYLALLLTGFTQAQIVTIPDANFKNVLISTNCVDTNPLYFDNVGDQSVDTNNDGEIQLSEASAVTNLILNNQSLTSLNGIENFTNLQNLVCILNPLGTLDLSSLTNLTSLNCSSCQLTSLILNEQHNLQGISCQSNLLTSLNLGNTAVTALNANNNPNLSYVNLKNGVISTCLSLIGMPDPCITFNSCPLLETICVDDEELIYQSFFTAMLTSYCSFTPGGNYNTILGTVTFDGNNNGCDATDPNFSNIRVNINDGTTSGASFTNNNTFYNFNTQAGSFDIMPSFQNPSWFNVSPTTATILFPDNNNNITTQNFCITSNGIHPDLEVVLVPFLPARPGFDAIYQIVYKNKGNQTVDGIVFFDFNYAYMDFVTATPAPSNGSFGYYGFNFTNLAPFESRSIFVTVNINAPTETNGVNIGDVLELNATVTLTSGATSETETADNIFALNQIVVGSYDPNDITCLQGTMVSPSEIGNFLHYIIRFENTGTAPAENIVVKIEVNPADFDINSLQLMNSSYPVTARINANKVEFIFDGINLDSGGHGNVLLKVRTKSNLVQGDLVKKMANIYFDYNSPIETNNAETVFQALNNPNFDQDITIKIYPNPTSSIININGNFNIKFVELLDIQGRLLQTNVVNQPATTIDVSNKSKGVYFIKITSDKGIKVEKIIKQ